MFLLAPFPPFLENARVKRRCVCARTTDERTPTGERDVEKGNGEKERGERQNPPLRLLQKRDGREGGRKQEGGLQGGTRGSSEARNGEL